jgi:ribosomal protein S18 acetylase RimI-like enzyme
VIDIRLLGSDDADTLTRVAPGVFDDPIDERSTRLFLSDPRHKLVVAVDEDVVVGFVSAVVYFHPDKTGPEMWINEVGVAPGYRRQGIGRLLIERVLSEAHDAGCGEAWVLTERHNSGAVSLYEKVGGVEGDPDTTIFTFHL